MSVQQHIERLHALRGDDYEGDSETIHQDADAILLDLIEDLVDSAPVAKLIRAAYAAVPKWYS